MKFELERMKGKYSIDREPNLQDYHPKYHRVQEVLFCQTQTRELNSSFDLLKEVLAHWVGSPEPSYKDITDKDKRFEPALNQTIGYLEEYSRAL